MKKGFFVSFEGGEGSGKSIQAQLLADTLKSLGYKVYLTKEPGAPDIPLNLAIRKILLSFTADTIPSLSEFLFFAADRAKHTEIIKQHLKQGEIVISDRFRDSSDAYQGVGRKVGITFTKFVNEVATDKLEPNLTFLLDLDPKIGLKRKRANRQTLNRLDKEALLFHQRVRKAYLKIAKDSHKRIVIINADRKIEAIQKEILNSVLENLEKGGKYDKN